MTNAPFDMDALKAQLGETAPPGDWLTLEQSMVDTFAKLTGDEQWIHTDPERARAESPFGGPVAHGLLVLSVIPKLTLGHAPWLEMGSMGVNYGADRLRFISPASVGARIRAKQTLISVEPYAEGAKIVTRIEVEKEGADKPACVVDMIGLIFP